MASTEEPRLSIADAELGRGDKVSVMGAPGEGINGLRIEHGDEQKSTEERTMAPPVKADEEAEPPYCILPEGEKIFIMLTVSFAAIISPISSSIYFPALDELATDMHVSISLINLTVTTYLVGLSSALGQDLGNLLTKRHV